MVAAFVLTVLTGANYVRCGRSACGAARPRRDRVRGGRGRTCSPRSVSAGLTLATAESLTGGLVGAALTAVAGSSDVYRGGIVCYATDLKASLVGVPAEVLAAHGPVAAETAAALAVGAARVVRRRRRAGDDRGRRPVARRTATRWARSTSRCAVPGSGPARPAAAARRATATRSAARRWTPSSPCCTEALDVDRRHRWPDHAGRSRVQGLSVVRSARAGGVGTVSACRL